MDEQQVTNVPIDPTSNNPIEVTQSTSVETAGPSGGVGEDGFLASINLSGSNVSEQVNIAIVIDQSGSTSNSSGTDFTGDGNDDSILVAELYAAQELFDAYVAAGYDPSEVTISLITYSTGAAVEGTFTLAESTEFTAALTQIANEGPGGWTNYVEGLDAVGDAWSTAGVGASDTNVVVFMSDGFPVPGGQNISGAAQDLEDDWGALITGVGLGVNSSLDALNDLDNTGGASQVLSGQELLDIVVEPLTDADFLRFEIVIEGVDANGDPLTQTLVFPEGDPNVISTQLGWSINNYEIDPIFAPPQELTINFNAYFAEDPGNPGSGEQLVTTQHILSVVPCFTPGTFILTPDGPVLIEDLEVGDRVITRDHGTRPIRWVGSTTLSVAHVAANPSLRPILIRKGALGPDQPERDMRLSRQHRVLVRDWRSEVMFGVEGGVLVPAFSLCNDGTVTEERPTESLTYIHIAFDEHEVVYADGVEAESFNPADRMVSAMSSAQKDELYTLFPELNTGDGHAFDSARHQVRGKDALVMRPSDD